MADINPTLTFEYSMELSGQLIKIYGGESFFHHKTQNVLFIYFPSALMMASNLKAYFMHQIKYSACVLACPQRTAFTHIHTHFHHVVI